MEPRARAGKNVGKMNFGNAELSSLLYGCGDVRQPLPETIKVMDEIATEFIQGLSFEATRVAQYSGRQKVKYQDFEFAFRRNPLHLGKVQEMFELKKQVTEARKMPGIDDDSLLKEAKQLAGETDANTTTGRGGKKRKIAAVQEEEELGEGDDDILDEPETVGKKR
ncbi:uncharacterized protein PgNI_06973 [Pyricularia grisea]|uniref:Transcription initiation factor TFIID subunit 13 n=1 Tax=Pyricularia grisea TaxID=148305 RepID=A0A6P8B1R0_PYRGI|nr:uncharacterized protein PgNI_06973 [Pyricularia grisea]TLD08653.1 hypothetical protein PgNI_06973 [Pyricularia grisea]